jgi:PAS domain S-box-containing protein
MSNPNLPPGRYSTLDLIPLGIFVLMDDFSVLHWNQSIAEQTGISPSEIQGKDIRDFYPNLGDKRFTARLSQVFQLGAPVVFSSQIHNHVIPIPGSGDSLRLQHTMVTPVAGDEPGKYHALFSIQDVTDLSHLTEQYRKAHNASLAEVELRKKVEEELRASEARFQDTTMISADIIWEFSVDGVCTYISGNVEDKLGYLPQDILGKQISELIRPSDAPKTLETLRDLLDQKKPLQEMEVWLLNRQGGEVCFLSSAIPLKAADGQVTGYRGVGKDITAQKKAEEALVISEQRYNRLVRGLGSLITVFSLGPDFRVTYVSQGIAPNFGVSAQSALGKLWSDAVKWTSEGHTRMAQGAHSIFHLGIKDTFETSFIHPSKGLRHALISGYPVADNEGAIVGIEGIAHDITDLRETQNALAKSEARYALAQRAAKVGSWEWSIHTGELYWSRECEEIFGFAAGEFDGTFETFLSRVHPDDQQYAVDSLNTCILEDCEYHTEHRIVLPDGQVRWVAENGDIVPGQDGKPDRMYGVTQDITERRLAMNAQQQLIEILEATPELVGMCRARDLDFLYLNPGGKKQLGFTPGQEIANRQLSSFLPIEGREYFASRLLPEALENGSWRGELTWERHDGSQFPSWTVLIAHKTKQGTVDRYSVMVRDISSLKEAENNLRKLNRAVEQSSASVVITDHKGNIEYVNPAFIERSGYSLAEVMHQNTRVLKSGMHDQEYYTQMWKTISSGKTWQGEICNRNKKGEFFWEQASISPVLGKNGEIVNFIAVKESVTDRKDLERLKEDVDRIMRHDLKTPLNGIIGIPQLLESDGNLTDAQLEMVKLIEDSGRRMLEMIDMSLDMFKMETRSYDYHPQPVDSMAVFKRLLEQYRAILSAKRLNIRMQLDGVEPGAGAVFMVKSEKRLLDSLLSNLLINAIEASPAGEEIVVSLQAGEPSLIRIRNQGVVPPEIRNNFFEKYKTSGKKSGTGLGTYSAKLLADTMNYTIGMETSDQDNETTIKINLPSGTNLQ